MYVVIIGAGRVGLSMANWLLEGNHEIALVERSSTKCETIDEELGAVTVSGDGTEAGVLAKAGANRAEVLIAATGTDDVNLVACQLAMHRFGVPRTITVIKNPEYRRLFEELGIGVVISTTEVVVRMIQQEISETLARQPGEPG